ncbi:MAG TPA: TadE family protein [Terracidiphilus sp.]
MRRAFIFQTGTIPKWALCPGFLNTCTHSEGSALVETALVLPVILMAVTGILIFGIFITQYMSLSEGVSNAGRVLAVSSGQTLDPCALAVSSVQGAAPILKPASMSYTVTMTPPGGTAHSYTQTSCSSTSTTTGAPGYLVSGGVVSLVATYSSCSLNYYGKNLMPNGCSISSVITESVQ